MSPRVDCCWSTETPQKSIILIRRAPNATAPDVVRSCRSTTQLGRARTGTSMRGPHADDGMLASSRSGPSGTHGPCHERSPGACHEWPIGEHQPAFMGHAPPPPAIITGGNVATGADKQ